MRVHASSALRMLLACLLPGAAQTAPERIVSLSGDITEIVYACGAADALVGVDSTSRYPPDAAELPQVGYVRNLSAEGVLSLRADLAIGTSEAGPPAVVEQLRDAGLKLHLIPEDNSVATVKRKIRDVAALLERPACAGRLIERLESRLAQARARSAKVAEADRPRVLFILNIAAGGPPLVGGRDTGADTVIGLAGGRNAAAGFAGYKPMAPEAILAAAPDVVLMFEDRLAGLGGAAGLAELPGIGLTPAVRGNRVYGLDGLLLLGFGPRVGEAAWRLNHLLFPDAENARDAR